MKKHLKKLVSLIFLSSLTIPMELPNPLDREKFKSDCSRLMHALEEISQHYGDQQHAIKSGQEKALFLKKFQGSWEREATLGEPLGYTFTSYMTHSGINDDWMKECCEEQQEHHFIQVKEFVKSVANRLNTKLAQYNNGSTK